MAEKLNETEEKQPMNGEKLGEGGEEEKARSGSELDGEDNAGERRLNGDTVALLQRTMGALYEMNPELEDSHEG